MATSTTYLSLIKPDSTDETVIRTIYNTNLDTIDGLAVGNANIATTGTITTGGLGTGATLGSVTMNIASSAANDIYYAGASNVLSRLAVNATATNKFLMTVSSGAPAWTELTSDHLSDVASIAMLDEAETVSGTYWTFTDLFYIDAQSDAPATTPHIVFKKARDGDPTADVSSADYLGKLLFEGYHTDGYDIGVIIKAIVDGDPGNGDMPGRLEFLTSPDTSATPLVRMVINNQGNVGIGAGSTFGANAVGSLQIANGTAPTAHVDDTISIYSVDSSDTTATLGLFLEQAVEEIGTFTATHKFKILLNGTEYWLQLDAV